MDIEDECSNSSIPEHVLQRLTVLLNDGNTLPIEAHQEFSELHAGG